MAHSVLPQVRPGLPDGRGSEQSPLGVALLVLRRRWLVALPLGLLLGALGAAAAYLLVKPIYQARALIRISDSRPYVVFPEDSGRNGSELPRYVKSQIELIRSPLVLGPVVGQKDFANLPEIAELDDPVTELPPLIEMKAVNDSELIYISFKGPSAVNSAKIVNAVTTAYFALRDQQEAERSMRVIELLEKESTGRSLDLQRLRDNVRELARQATGMDPFAASGNSDKTGAHPLAELQKQLTMASVEHSTLRAQITAYEEMLAKGAREVPAAVVEQAVEQCNEVQRLKTLLAEGQTKLRQTEAAAVRGREDPAYRRGQQQIEQAQQMLDKVRQDVRAQLKDQLEAGQAGRREADLAALKLRLEGAVLMERELGSRYQEQLKDLQQASGGSLELDFKRDELKRAQDVHERILSRIIALRTERSAPARVELLVPASVPGKPLEKWPYRQMGLCLLVGLVSPFGLMLLWEWKLRRISDPAQFQQQAQVVVIGEIASLPSRTRARSSSSPAVERGLRLFHESIDSLRTCLVLSESASAQQVLAVTSAVSREGKTSVAAELAVSIARAAGARTLLIDGDMRDPDLHLFFDIALEPGLAQVLNHEASLETAVVATQNSDLDLLPAGRLRTSPHALLGNGALVALLDAARVKYRYIIIDTPPVLPASEALVLAKAADATLVCVMRDFSRLAQVRTALERLAGAGARLAGTVFNNVPVGQYAYKYGDYEHHDQD